MDTTPDREPVLSSATTADETLTEVRKRLVRIRASVAESLSTDPNVVPWVESELVDLIRYIRSAQRAITAETDPAAALSRRH